MALEQAFAEYLPAHKYKLLPYLNMCHQFPAAAHSEMLMELLDAAESQLCFLSRLSLTPLLSSVAKELLQLGADYVLHVIYCLGDTRIQHCSFSWHMQYLPKHIDTILSPTLQYCVFNYVYHKPNHTSKPVPNPQ